MYTFKLAIAFILSSLTLTVYADETRDPYKHFFIQSLGDYTEELQMARDDGKKGIFLFFEMDECPFCHYMKNNVLNRKSVQESFLKDFSPYAIDIEGDVMITTFEGEEMKMKDYAFKVHRVRATPVMAFFDLEGNRIFRFTGKTRGVDEFRQMQEFVAGGHYKDMSFNNYKRKNR
ncbi:MAG: thioredoxin fold domain-containing protein [Gammaproteobacteria bacterium]|nr:thioredoxin fold domain-containing protein [Gammaproteobacteria bacterium]